MILVPVETEGVIINRALTVFGYDHAPHGHGDVTFDNVRVPASNMLLGEGRGFEIAQGRLGPGRIHHCMRCIGQAERALESMKKRANSRVAFGQKLSDMGALRHKVAEARIKIDQTRRKIVEKSAIFLFFVSGDILAKTRGKKCSFDFALQWYRTL